MKKQLFAVALLLSGVVCAGEYPSNLINENEIFENVQEEAVTVAQKTAEVTVQTLDNGQLVQEAEQVIADAVSTTQAAAAEVIKDSLNAENVAKTETNSLSDKIKKYENAAEKAANVVVIGAVTALIIEMI